MPTPVVYDIETFPNVFTLSACTLGNPSDMFTWELSQRRNDMVWLLQWFAYLRATQTEMIGFNNLAFDYPVIHFIYMNPNCSVQDIYALAQKIIQTQNRGDRFNNFQVWQSDRFAPQIDVFKIHHFDNMAKSTSLKSLQFNMRSPLVQDMPVAHGTVLNDTQIDELIYYNRHDVTETDRFAAISGPNIKFRRALTDTLGGDVLNFNDTKIGKQMFEQRLGPELCFDWSSGRKQPRQSHRDQIPLAPIIFPYIKFKHPEFNRVLGWLRQQVITETKGAFTDVKATINGFEFHFGTGGIHGSVTSKAFAQDADHALIDWDVAGLYPSIGIVNGLFPEHLGTRFGEVWSEIIAERKKHKKGTPENAALKLAANGPYGDSNNVYSPLYDPRFTMSITINGQLLLCMLAEWLLDIPTLQIIQINTDGVTFRVHREWEPWVKSIWTQWQAYTGLVLEEARYNRMFIRDVNNYVAEGTDGKLKSKGAYWYPVKFPEDISNASPSAWYKDLSSPIVQKAAEAAMIRGVDPAVYISLATDPFEFMILAKAKGASQLFLGETPVQKTLRYFIAHHGAPLRKVSPPVAGATPGAFKKRNGVGDYEYMIVMTDLREQGRPDDWDARIHTKNKSVYEDRETSIQSGWLVADCCDASHFDWSNVNREWYIEQARKLIIR